ncbi:FecR family protein [Erythrobacter sp. BLCC-B19]|uniref:FecR family protein n=1 Tax=Erythrobacter sp. BLCC-B19 TaxID=3025315 RepID=UPI002362FB89|nr:FecR domain-containing protein [Erythrobacter sp. BLCC-B19]WDA39809.1 FecR domain-containing protein [Erythrobacter sp. BLCC-B19]
MKPDLPIHDAALHWALQTGEPDFADWDAFTAWLEADPAHGRAYDAAQVALDEAAALVPASETEPVAANDNAPGWLSGGRAWLGGAVAAALVLATTFLIGFWPQGEALYVTAPGETRLIALDDGSSVTLGGGSRLTIEGARAARLESGQALFTIRHDAADPFVLQAGATRLVDAGTVFDVRMVGTSLDVAVAEGAVIIDPQAQGVRVDAGQRAVGTDGVFRVDRFDAASVGEWSRGRITFQNATLADIAADLTRATGTTFTSTDSATRLSGSIALDAVKADPRALEGLLGVRVRPRTDGEGEGWVIAAR